MRDPEMQSDHNYINNTMIPNFTAQYRLKTVFADAAAYCIGQ